MATPFPFGSGNTLTAAQMNAITTLPINDQTASYVALVGDVGKRIVMNVATANTVTINNSVFAVGDTIFIANKGAGTSTVTAGAGVTINTSSSLALAQHGGGTLVALSASVFTFFSGGGATYGTATGGTTITPWTISSVNYNGSQFTSDGTLTVTKAGLFDILMVGGGGGGGQNTELVAYVGGGGGGGIYTGTIFLEQTTYSIDVGAGGAAKTDGLPSRFVAGSFTSLTATGGGKGAGNYASNQIGLYAGAGGSGGGGTGYSQAIVYAGATGMQGFNGGNGVTTHGQAGGGGGGGSANGTAGSGTVAGAGGAGLTSSFSGVSTTYAAGGTGGGASGAGRATTGGANTGDGGGANNATGSDNSAAGGSGIVIVRFKV